MVAVGITEIEEVVDLVVLPVGLVAVGVEVVAELGDDTLQGAIEVADITSL